MKHIFSISAAIALAALLGAPLLASAHEHQEFKIGTKYYQFTVGSLNEPVAVDDKTGVDLRVNQISAPISGHDETMQKAEPGTPVTGLESTLKVELIAGKTIPIQGKNQHHFAGKIQAENVSGWGFTQYRVSQLGALVSTRMAVDPDAPMVEQFISLAGEPFLIRYNSKIPVVIYAPEGVEVRYRIWNAQAQYQKAKQG